MWVSHAESAPVQVAAAKRRKTTTEVDRIRKEKITRRKPKHIEGSYGNKHTSLSPNKKNGLLIYKYLISTIAILAVTYILMTCMRMFSGSTKSLRVHGVRMLFDAGSSGSGVGSVCFSQSNLGPRKLLRDIKKVTQLSQKITSITEEAEANKMDIQRAESKKRENESKIDELLKEYQEVLAEIKRVEPQCTALDAMGDEADFFMTKNKDGSNKNRNTQSPQDEKNEMKNQLKELEKREKLIESEMSELRREIHASIGLKTVLIDTLKLLEKNKNKHICDLAYVLAKDRFKYVLGTRPEFKGDRDLLQRIIKMRSYKPGQEPIAELYTRQQEIVSISEYVIDIQDYADDYCDSYARYFECKRRIKETTDKIKQLTRNKNKYIERLADANEEMGGCLNKERQLQASIHKLRRGLDEVTRSKNVSENDKKEMEMMNRKLMVALQEREMNQSDISGIRQIIESSTTEINNIDPQLDTLMILILNDEDQMNKTVYESIHAVATPQMHTLLTYYYDTKTLHSANLLARQASKFMYTPYGPRPRHSEAIERHMNRLYKPISEIHEMLPFAE